LFSVGLGAPINVGIHDRALPHRHPTCAEVGIDGLKDLPTQVVLLQQVPEGQDRALIRHPVTDQVNACKTTHGGHLDQGLFHSRITEGVPLLQQVDPQHG
jgi:hypothetical protein